MKQGITDDLGRADLNTLFATARNMKESARDYTGSTSELFMHADGSIEVNAAGGVPHELPTFHPTKHATRQMTGWAKIDARYADRCPPELLAINLNHWFKNGVDDKGAPARMLRTMQPSHVLGIERPTLRAFVSDKFKRIDNYDYLQTALPVLAEFQEKGLVIESCNIGEHLLNLKGRIDGIEEVILKPGHVMGEGHNTFYRVRPGFDLRNGETGKSAISYAPAIYDTGCTNLAVIHANAQRRLHVGAAQADQELWCALSDETQAKTNEALLLQLRDYIRASLDSNGEVFKRVCDQIREKMGLEVKRPEATFKLVADQFGLTEVEQNIAVGNLIERGDMSVMGVQAAITQLAQADEIDYERATELEGIGGAVIDLPGKNWTAILAQADELKVKVAA
jgi:hypothetical protein